MKGAEIAFDLTGIEKTVKMLDGMGVKVQPAVNKAALAGIKPVQKAIKGRAPVEAGKLKRAIGRLREKTRKKGKRVYEVTFRKQYNEELQRPIKRPGIYGGKSPKAYYPASQEYGFLTRAKGGGVEFRNFGRYFYKYTASPEKGVKARDDLADWYAKYGNDPNRSIELVRKGRHGGFKNGYLETVKGVASRKVEGEYYMKKGAEQTASQAQDIMIKTMEKELDKIWQEATHV